MLCLPGGVQLIPQPLSQVPVKTGHGHLESTKGKGLWEVARSRVEKLLCCSSGLQSSRNLGGRDRLTSIQTNIAV